MFRFCLLLIPALLSATQKSDSGNDLTNYESEPSSVIDSVNLITGDFVDFDKDITLMGPVPLIAERSRSGKLFEGSLDGGWNHNWGNYLSLLDSQKKLHHKHTTFTFSSGHGEKLKFDIRKTRNNEVKIPVDQDHYDLGVTNCASGQISGRNHIKNTEVLLYKDRKECVVKKGDGTRVIFTEAPERSYGKGLSYDFVREMMPSGNQMTHEYLNKNSRYTARNKHGKELGWIEYRHPDDYSFYWPKCKNTYPRIRVETSDNRSVEYVFQYLRYRNEDSPTINCDGWVLKHVHRPDAPSLSFDYLVEKYNTGLLLNKVKPEGRYSTVDYYLYKRDNPVGPHKKIKINDKSDYRIHKVRRLLAPLGKDNAPQVKYQFHYEEVKGKDYFTEGLSTVWNARGQKTRYRHKLKRLDTIERFSDSDVYSKECFVWGDAKSGQNCNLMQKRLEDSTGKVVYEKNYEYDARHNVTKDTVKGNICGKGQVDAKEKHSAYTDDGFNLLLTQVEGPLTTYLDYFPGTNLVKLKIIQGTDGLYKREFFHYNEDAVKVMEITDDGKSRDQNDISDISERRIRKIEVNERGLPIVVSDLFLNAAGQEEILKKEVNTYNSHARLIRQEIYDKDLVHQYSLEWDYDAMGNLTRERDEMGVDTHRHYDANGNMVRQHRASEEFYYQWKYDYMDRMIVSQEIHPDRTFTTHLAYDVCGNKESETDTYGNTTFHKYNKFNMLNESRSPAVPLQDGSLVVPTVHKSYGILGNITEEIDAEGGKVSSVETLFGKPSSITYPDGSSEHFRMDLQGKIVEKTARNGTKTFYEYDSFGRLIHESIENEIHKHSRYNTFHLLTETDASGLVTEYTYDRAGRKIKETCGCKTTTFEYDALGRVYSIASNSLIVNNVYDAKNRVIEEKTFDLEGSLLGKVGYFYDSMGRKTHTFTYTDAGVSVDEKRFNSKGDLIWHRNAHDEITTTFYDYDYRNELGQRVLRQVMVDPLGKTLETILDTLGRVARVSVLNPLGDVVQRTDHWYTLTGKKIKSVETVYHGKEALRTLTNRWEWDSCGRQIAVLEGFGKPEVKTTRYTYTASGQKESIIKPDGQVVKYAYDKFDRVVHVKGGDVDYEYEYDLMSRPFRVKDLVHQRETIREFDKEHNLIQEILGNGLAIGYGHDAAGRVNKWSLPKNGSVEFKYRGARIQELIRKDRQGSETYKATYDRFDLSGKVKELTLPGNLVVKHTYDKLQRPLTVESNKWNLWIEPYDGAGNLVGDKTEDEFGIVARKFKYDELYQVASETGLFNHKYHHDSLYNLIQKDDQKIEYNDLNQPVDSGQEFDRNGNLIRKGAVRYKFDILDRLIGVTEDNKESIFTYDESNRRLTYNAKSFLYRGQDEIGMYEDGELKEFRLLGIGLGSEAGASLALEIQGEIYAPLHDNNGNLAALYDLSGNLVSSHRFSAFGEFKVEGKLISPWLYSGKRWDSETRLYNFGRRFYDPNTHRWLSADPIKFDGGSNLYAYVMNSPLIHLDAYGLSPINGLQPGWACRSWNACKEWGAIGAKLPGYALEFFGAHFIPIPFVRDVFEVGGKILSGQSTKDYTMAHKRNHTRNGAIEGAEGADRKGWLFYCINGINTTYEEAVNNAKKMSLENGGVTVHFTYNGSRGIITDLIESAAQKIGISMGPDKALKENIIRLIEENGGTNSNVKILMQAHSQGGMTAGNLVNNLGDEYTKKIHLRTIGSASIVSNKGFASVKNYVSRLDGVPLSDPWGYAKGLMGINNLIVLEALSGYTFDHLYDKPTYRYARDEINKEFKNLIGL